MLIQRLLFVLAIAALTVCGRAEAAHRHPLAAWFQSGRCASFNNIASPKVPYARNSEERLEWVHHPPPFQPSGAATYIYDAAHGVVFRTLGQDSTRSFILRKIANLPARVRRADLSGIATSSGIRIGTSAQTVQRKLGKPYVLHACGLERFAYLINRQVGGNALEFTIQNGRVVEIYQTYGD